MTLDDRQKVLEPYCNWDSQIRFSMEMEELSESDTGKAVNAFNYLRRYLGEDFPINALLTDHPICDFFINRVPWTRLWFVWLVECIQKLQGGDNFNKILRDLRNPVENNFEDALILMEYGLLFKNIGWQVSFEHPIVNRLGKLKKPDLHLENPQSGESIYCEIIRLTKDPLFRAYESLMSRVVHGGFRYGKYLNFSGEILSRISLSEFELLLDDLEVMIQKAAQDRIIQTIKREKIINLAIAIHKDRTLDDWAKDNGCEVNALGMPEVGIFHRAKQKILHKALQSSCEHPNILILKLEDILFLEASPDKWITEIEKFVLQCEDIMAVVLIHHEFGGFDKIVRSVGMNYYIQREERYAIGSKSIIVFNSTYKKHGITIDSLQKIFKSFM